MFNFCRKSTAVPLPLREGLGEGYVKSKEFASHTPHLASPARGEEHQRSATAFFLLSLIWLYRHTLSYFLGRQCRFLPTCSAYADEAIRVYGAGKGSALAFRRLCRCHPWGGQGFDPVPLPPGK